MIWLLQLFQNLFCHTHMSHFVTLCHKIVTSTISRDILCQWFVVVFVSMYIFSATASLLADKTNECIAISRKNYVIHTCVTRRHMPFHVKMICYCCCFCLCSSISNIFPQTSATVASSQTSMVRLTTAKLLNHLDSYLQTVLWFNFTRFFFVFFLFLLLLCRVDLIFLILACSAQYVEEGKTFLIYFLRGPIIYFFW